MTHHFQRSWERMGQWRRILLLFLISTTTVVASTFMAQVLPHRGTASLESLLILFFAALFAWISIGFWIAVFGFFTLLRRYDRFMVSRTEDGPLSDQARTAVLIPICNEEVDRVFGGVYSTYRSLEQTGRIELFDFFILSDTDDPDKWIEEEAAWAELGSSLGGDRPIYYRNRRVNIKRKTGNIAEFCRRWGFRYRYMIVFDADSIMSGRTLTRMVAIMEKRPDIGILQTAPRAVNAKTLFGRLQQFANRTYGPMFSAGLHFWQLGDAQYLGHNAIIRIDPFMEHCALPRLSGHPPLGGDILSHDFVEAALMRRAGWGVWLAFELSGSYEEGPPTLLDELKRDRRWCQGNLQHLRLVFTRGLIPTHRVLFLAGAMAYVSGPLWFLFLALSTAQAFFEALTHPSYFPQTRALFPNWPVWNPGWAFTLIISTAVLLFLPKLLSILIVAIKQRRAKEFGGVPRLLASVAAEVILSSLIAPIRMIFHSKFVFLTLIGRQVGWDTQQRKNSGTSWREAFRVHGSGMVFGLIWGAGVLAISPSFFWWLIPVIAALILSVPLSVWSSGPTAGRRFQALGLFLTPEETSPPREIRRLQSYVEKYRTSSSPLQISKADGFVRAVVDPCINALHLSLLRKQRRYSESILRRRRSILERAINFGPNRLTKSEKKELLSDHSSMAELHKAAWTGSDNTAGRMWGIR